MKLVIRILYFSLFLVSQLAIAQSDEAQPVGSDFTPTMTAVGFTVEKDFNHNRPLLLESLDGGETWAKALSNLTNLPTSGVFEKTSCTGYGLNAVCIAVGSQDEYKSIPLLAVKANASNAWFVKNLKSQGSLYGASCTGYGANAMCAIGLQDFTSPAFVIVSLDGGNHWYKRAITGLAVGANIELASISCTGQSPNAVCVAIGAQTLFENHEFTGFKPIIVVGDGRHWETKAISSLTDNMLLSDVSCSGSGSSATCVAIGSADHDSPAIIVSQDGGETWSKKVINDMPKSSDLKHVSCSGSEKSTICAAVGGTLIDPMGKYSPLIVVSADNGATWSIKLVHSNVNDSEYSKELLSIHCQNEGSQSLCVAAGFKELPDPNADSESIGVIAVSVDGGKSWQEKAVDDLPAETNFFSNVSCTRNDLNSVCTAVGGADGKPLIAMSNDNGHHWNVSRALIGLQLRNGVLLDNAATH